MILGILVSLLGFGGMPDINLWVDRENAEYYPTEKLTIFFRSDEDCYVSVYNVDVGGREYLLFPLEGESGWIESDVTYELPPPDGDYDYVVGGEPGIEKVIVLASTERLPELVDSDPDIVREAIEIAVLEPEPATLKIISTPPECRIHIIDEITGEEEYMGKTPETMILHPGEYTVELYKFGFKTLKRKIWLDPGERRRVFATLKPY
jgi:hypothetical protein